MKIKVCGLKHPHNIKQIVDSNIDFAGFIFYDESKRHVNRHTLNFLKTWNTKVLKVGVFVNHDLDQVKSIVKTYSLDFVQLHGDETPEYLANLTHDNIKLIKAFQINPDFNWDILADYQPFVKYFLFDTPTPSYGGSGKHFNWELLRQYYLDTPFFLSGGIGLQDVSLLQKLNMPNLYAIDVNSQFELKAGLKDSAKLNQFVNKIR